MVNQELNTNLSSLFKALKKVRNKYFFNLIFIGIFNFFSFVLISVLVLFLFDYSFRFSGFTVTFLRAVLYLYVLCLFIFFIGKHLFNWLFNYTKYSYKYFGEYVGSILPEINDKIINILELNDSVTENSLIEYSIINKLKFIKFNSFKSIFSFKLLFYHLIFTIAIIVISFLFYKSSPQNFKYSQYRLLNFKQDSTINPYNIEIFNFKKFVYKGFNYNIKCVVRGSFIPDKIFIEIGDDKLLLNDSLNFYYFNLENIQSNFEFRLVTDEYTSSTFKVKCIPVPKINNINIKVIPPSYTNIESYSIKSVGNFTFPYGSQIIWNLSVLDADNVSVFIDSVYHFNKINKDYVFSKQLFKTFNYSLILKNSENDSLYKYQFSANVLDDNFPKFVNVNFESDFTNNFTGHGTINDDYGFHNLELVFKYGDSIIKQKIPIDINSNNQEFYFSGNFSDYFRSEKKSSLSVFFKVFDNDPFYPYKASVSSSKSIVLPNKSSLSRIEDSTINNLRQKLDMTAQMFKAIKKNEFDIRKKLVSESLSSWDKELLVNDIRNSQKDLMKLKNSINKLNSKLQKLQNTNKENKLLEKQKKINDLLEKLMDKDIKKMLAELDKLKQELNNKKNSKLNINKFSFDEANIELERSLELLKKYEIEKSINYVVDKLKLLKDEYKNTSRKDLDKTDSLKNELNNTLDKHDSIIKENKSLSSPLKISDFSKQKENIKKEAQSLQKSNSDSKKEELSDDIDDLANKIENDFNKSAQQQQGEDSELLELILHNLILLSYEQENLIYDFDGVVYLNNNELKQKQLNIKSQFQVIQDSLIAIAKRNFSVSTFIGDNIRDVSVQLANIKQKFGQDMVISIQLQQQVVLKAFNELVLVISESLEQMDSQSNGSGGGCGKARKNKKKGSKGKPKNSQSLKQQLQQMINDLKKSKNQGMSKGQGQKLIQMLGQQEMMQQNIQDIMKNYNLNSDSKRLFNQIEKSIDQNIDNILNKQINNNIVDRQKKILTKLLESDKAMLERDKDKKREGEKPNNYKISNPKVNFEYKSNKNLNKGLLYKHTIKLNYFFQRIFESYRNKLENE